jgi:hypothetical protein
VVHHLHFYRRVPGRFAHEGDIQARHPSTPSEKGGSRAIEERGFRSQHKEGAHAHFPSATTHALYRGTSGVPKTSPHTTLTHPKASCDFHIHLHGFRFRSPLPFLCRFPFHSLPPTILLHNLPIRPLFPWHRTRRAHCWRYVHLDRPAHIPSGAPPDLEEGTYASAAGASFVQCNGGEYRDSSGAILVRVVCR